MEDDNLSSVSFVSSISAGSIHQPKPPDGPKPSSQGFRAKRNGKIIRSPYLATSTPYPSKKQLHRLVNGTTGGLHHDLDDTHYQAPGAAINSNAKQRWAKAVTATGGSPMVWNSKYLPHPSASVFLQSLMKAPSFSAVVTSKKRKRTQSASTGSRKNATHSSVGSDGKDAIALRDEVVELKKSLNSVTRERDLTQAKYAKLEQALAKKDKEIEDLLASGHITSRDATRSLASSSGTSNKQRRPSSTSAGPGSGGGSGSAVTASGSGAVIASLRGKIHSLERALREKESALAALKREVNATRLREMEIQCEAYYREITRLTQLLADQAAPLAPGSPLSHRESQLKLKALNQATVKLASQLEQREAENQRLKQQLDKFRSESRTGGEAISHNEQGLRGSIADRYVDHKRSELLSTIVDLELCLREKEGTLASVCGEMQEKKTHYERRIGELSGKHNDANNRIKLLEGRLSEMGTSQEKLRNIIRKLKDDRTHYRTVAEDTQSELQVIQDKLEKEGTSKNDIIQELEALREKHQNEILARDHARKLSKRRSQLLMSPEKERRQAAALTIQQQWRKRHAVRRQTKFQEATEQGILDIQSALRGHITRRRLLSSQPSSQASATAGTHSSHSIEVGADSVGMSSDASDSESSETCVAVERIQAALRGHVARQMALHDLGRSSDGIGSGVYLHGDPRSASVTELWQTPLPTSSSRDPQIDDVAPARMGYQPPNRVRQKSSRGAVKNREQMKPQNHRKSKGQVQSPWHLPRSLESSGDDTQPGEEIEVERGLVPPAPSLHPGPGTSFSSYTDSDVYISNPEQALLADELT